MLLFFIIMVSIVAQESKTDNKRILFLGNSITAGFGLSEEQAYPALVQKKVDSLKLDYICQNAGLSGETTSGGLRRLDWLLKQKVDILIIALGGNDGLRGIPPALSKENLAALVDKARQKFPDIKVILAGMEAPPNMGKDFTDKFKSIFEQVAKEKETFFVPFLLAGVAGDKDLNLADGIHPNEKGQKIVAQNIWKILKQII